MSRASRAERWPFIWAAIVIALALALAGTLIALASRSTGNAAGRQAQATADCVNRVLAERDVIAGKQHEADVTRVKGQKVAEAVKAHGLAVLAAAKTEAQRRAGFSEYVRGELLFQRTLDVYIATSDQLRAEQRKHPLGAC